MRYRVFIALLVMLAALLFAEEEYTITFKVFNAEDYSPIKGAEIYVEGKLIGKTNESGAFSHRFAVGDYNVLVKAEGFKPEERQISVIIDFDEEFYLVPQMEKRKTVSIRTYKRKFAVLVGVSETADKNIPKLRFADSDVDRMKDILTSYFAIPPENIFVLKSHPDESKGENRSTKGIFLGILDKLINDYKPSADDLLIIYMSTHGETVPDESGDEPDGYDEVFAMSDSKLGLVSSFLFDDELAEKLSKIQSRKVLVFDACYIAGRKSMVIKVEEEQQDDLVENSDVIITSSAPGAASYESEELGSSIFMSAFAKTVEDYNSLDENSDGFVDSSEFFKALKTNLEGLSQRYLGFTQTPTMKEKNPVVLLNIKTATLNVSVQPGGAEVFIDGEKVGKGGDLTIEIGVGYHSLRVVKSGYSPFEETVKVKPGMNELKIELVKEGGWLVGKVVDAETKEPVSGAEVMILGYDEILRTDEKGEFGILLPAGTYRGVVIKKEGYEVLKMEEPIMIKRGKVTKVFELKKLAETAPSGEVKVVETYLSVRSNIVGASVFLDDSFIGKTPIEKFPVDPGTYKLKCVSDTGEIIEKRLTVMRGKNNAVFVEFKKTTIDVIEKPKSPEILKVARVIINSVPSEANVYVAGDSGEKHVGKTPITLRLKEGWYSFKIQKEGYKTVVIDEDYYLAGDEVRFNVDLVNERARELLSEALKSSGRRKIELLEEAYSLDEYDKMIALELIKAYMSYTERREDGSVVHPYAPKAQRLLKVVLSTMSDDPTVHLYAGIIYFNRFDYKRAREEWKKAIELSPSTVQAYYYLYKSYKLDPFAFGEEKRELMKKYALDFVNMVKYLKLEKTYSKELEEIYGDFPDLKEWGK